MILEVEKPLLELEQKIRELREVNQGGQVDLSKEIAQLERKAEELKNSIYSHLTAWDRVQIARHAHRPNTLDYVREIFTDFVELHGDRHFGDDAAIVAGFARFEGRGCCVIGHQKGKDTKENLSRNFGMPNPEGFRKAARLMTLAARFDVPIFTFVDTPGAYPGIEAEERGQYEAIASSIALMTELPVPIVTLVIGEGGSGGALGIAVGDRVMMLENSVYSVISPEGCAAILWKDRAMAPEAAAALKIGAQDLYQLGVIDRVVPEPLGGAHRDPKTIAETLRIELREMLRSLQHVPIPELRELRLAKFLKMGVFTETPE